ncbi:MAG: hypothetical protein ACK5N0_15670 [Synechococcaceae cyanobacterium]
MAPVVLNDIEFQPLQSVANSRSLPHSIVQRAQIVLAYATGEINTSIAKRMEPRTTTIGKWRERSLEMHPFKGRDEQQTHDIAMEVLC